jgi:hypothetical protein
MSLRIMLSPAVQIAPNVYQPKAERYCSGGCVHIVPSLLTGIPASSVVLTLGRAADWTAADADAQIELVIAVPTNINTPAELVNRLRTATVGDLTTAQRTSMQAVFDNHGIPRGDFVLATPLSKVFRRLVSWLFEQDESFGFGFSF